MEPKLYKEYVKDGTLRIEWRDFPYRGQESVNAAVAARAAQAQGEVLGVPRPALRQPVLGLQRREPNRAGREKPASTHSGSRVIMRMPATNRWCVLISGRAWTLGVNGTPTFFINGKMLVGLQPIGVFENAIEDARREAEGG